MSKLAPSVLDKLLQMRIQIVKEEIINVKEEIQFERGRNKKSYKVWPPGDHIGYDYYFPNR